MPSYSYDIQYRPGDFFYNTAYPTENQDLLLTFPFTSESVIEWANEVAKPEPPIYSINNIFDPQISSIILNPTYDFQNTFLPGNMVFNNNFDDIAINLTNPILKINNKMSSINGNVVIVPKDENKQNMTLKIKDSNIKWKQDETNSWQPRFDINTNLLSEDIPFTDIDGQQSMIKNTSMNPRCKYREKCTMNHLHYSGGCKTQTIKGPKGSYCKCVCTGGVVKNNKPHSHCSTLNINKDGTMTSDVGKTRIPGGVDFLSTVQGIRLNLTGKFPGPVFGSANGNITIPYNEKENLIQHDIQIRQMVFDYYTEVNKNIQLQDQIKNKGNKDDTMKQALLDATVQYKTEYLNVFNMIVGVFGVGGYIYMLSKAS